MILRTIKKAALSMALLVAGTTLAAAETIAFTATLNATSEVPPNASTGTGSLTANFDTVTKQLSWVGNYSGLGGDATAAHFHGPALMGANAGVSVPIVSFKSPFTGTAALTDAQFEDLTTGKWYVNIHTAKSPNGEIRGQLVQDK